MKRYNRKKSYISTLILLIIIFIGIGYAYLQSNLSISGTTEVIGNTWGIHFANISVTEGSIEAVSPATIDPNDNTKVDFSIILSKPGDFYEFTVDAVNDGSIDSMIGNINNVELTEAQQKYLEYNLTYSDGSTITINDKLLHNSSEKLKCRIEFKSNIENDELPSNSQNLTLSFSFNYLQSNSNARERDRIITIGLEKDNMEIGDYFAIGTNILGNNHIIGNNETILSDWRIFNKDENGISIILADYTPNSYFEVSTVGLEARDEFQVRTMIDRLTLINGLKSSNWLNYLNNSNIAGKEGISIKGTPELEEFIESWSSHDNYTTIYTKTASNAHSDGFYGLYIGLTENPRDYDVNISSNDGYNDSLYFPHKNNSVSNEGYWLASPCAESVGELYSVKYNGIILGYDDYLDTGNGLSPIIYLPNNLVIIKENNIWTVE